MVKNLHTDPNRKFDWMLVIPAIVGSVAGILIIVAWVITGGQ